MKNIIENLSIKRAVQIKFWTIMIMICMFGYITQIMINESQIEYMIVCGGLLIFDMIIYSMIDSLYRKILVNDIEKHAAEYAKNQLSLSKYIDNLMDNQKKMHMIAAKYETCWKTLKRMLEESNNNEFIKCMDSIEEMVMPSVTEEVIKSYEVKK